jgi:hypothetical protein
LAVINIILFYSRKKKIISHRLVMGVIYHDSSTKSIFDTIELR